MKGRASSARSVTSTVNRPSRRQCRANQSPMGLPARPGRVLVMTICRVGSIPVPWSLPGKSGDYHVVAETAAAILEPGDRAVDVREREPLVFQIGQIEGARLDHVRQFLALR